MLGLGHQLLVDLHRDPALGEFEVDDQVGDAHGFCDVVFGAVDGDLHAARVASGPRWAILGSPPDTAQPETVAKVTNPPTAAAAALSTQPCDCFGQ